MAAADPVVRPGTSLGRYRVLERVGEGAKGVVYRAVDEARSRTVAIKLLREPHDRAMREAQVLSRLDHSRIVELLDIVEYDERVGLVQPWVDGPTLEELLAREGPFSVRRTLGLGIDVASALEYAHGLGILHRDLKPSNVLRGRDGFLLTDFGAFGVLMTESAATMAGQIAGTPLWMSPEQIAGESQTVASDVFGLGLLLFASLYGDPPSSTATSYIELAYQRVRDDIVVPESPLRPLLVRCLDRRVESRPQTVAEVRAELKAILSVTGTGTATPQTPRTEPVPYPSVEMPGHLAPPPLERSPRPASLSRRSLLAVQVSGVIGVLAFGTLIVVLIKRAGVVETLSGLVVLSGGLAVAAWLRRRSSESEHTLHRASEIVLGDASRADLSRSLTMDLQVMVERLKTFDARFIRNTVVALALEYDQAADPTTRVAALQQLLLLEERVARQLTPWHIRHKELIALVISVASCLASVASVLVGLLSD